MAADPATGLLPHALLRERLFGQPLLAHPDAVAAVMAVLADRLGIAEIEVPYLGEMWTFAPDFLAGTAQDQIRESRQYRVQDGVATIPVLGKLVKRSGSLRPPSGFTGYNAIGAALDMALADQDVRGIALDIDSPGGEATGAFDLWKRVADARGAKPIWAIVHGAATSAAYGLASAADRVVAPEVSDVGSIGVVSLHTDLSGALAQGGIKVTILHAGARKVDGNSFQALPPEVAGRVQAQLDHLHGRFVQIVAANRGTTQKAVRDTEAETFRGHEAKDRGLVDAVAPPHEALAEFTQFVNRGASRSARGAGMAAPTNGAAELAAAETYARADLDRARTEGLEQGRRESSGANDLALAQARAEGVAAERTRVGAILGHEQAQGRSALAQSLALETDLTAEQAGKVLAKAPKEPPPEPARVEVVRQATDFADHMARQGNPQVGADLSDEDAEMSGFIARARQREGRAN